MIHAGGLIISKGGITPLAFPNIEVLVEKFWS